MSKISLIVQSRGTLPLLKHMLACYCAQTHADRELILVIDELFTEQTFLERSEKLGIKKEDNAIILTNLTTNFPHKNVSAMRNSGIQRAKGEFINLMDDDEDFAPEYFAKSVLYRKKYRKKYTKDLILTPTLMYRHTGKIQNQGFSCFNYWLSRPTPCVLKDKEYAEIQMYSGNSLFGPTEMFKHQRMDERFDFVYEDLDYSYTLYQKGYPIVVVRDLEINHMEKDKTKLDDAWIGNVYQAHRKAKHRILFVKKHATRYQKIQFYLLGFWGQPLRLVAKIFLLAQKKDIFPLLKAIIQGTWEGMRA